jgi:hypothetical protein
MVMKSRLNVVAGKCDYYYACVVSVEYSSYECRYMSVNRVWWMSWSSKEPKRSGAFKVEIIEKASTVTFSGQVNSTIDKMKESIRRPTISLGHDIKRSFSFEITSSLYIKVRQMQLVVSGHWVLWERLQVPNYRHPVLTLKDLILIHHYALGIISA